MNYKSYLKVKDTPNRRMRKAQRNTIFQYNYKLRARLNREKRELNKNSDQ